MNHAQEINQKNAAPFEIRVGIHFDGPILMGFVIVKYQRLAFW
jgi:hypothetical protein